jgi:hypothetical protein
MPVYVEFRCGGCDAKAPGTKWLLWSFVSVSGRPDGFGSWRMTRGPDDVAPEGWVAHDPYTGATYCAECWGEIISDPMSDHAQAQQAEKGGA